MVITEKYREVFFNERFHQFALRYEFIPKVCEGYDPESKGEQVIEIRELDCEKCEGLKVVKETNAELDAFYESLENKDDSNPTT